MQLGSPPNPSYVIAKALLNYGSPERSRYSCPAICLFPESLLLRELLPLLQPCLDNQRFIKIHVDRIQTILPHHPLFLLTSVFKICVANVIISNSPSNSPLHQSCEPWFSLNREVLKGKRNLRVLWVVDWNCASVLARDSTKGSSET